MQKETSKGTEEMKLNWKKLKVGRYETKFNGYIIKVRELDDGKQRFIWYCPDGQCGNMAGCRYFTRSWSAKRGAERFIESLQVKPEPYYGGSVTRAPYY